MFKAKTPGFVVGALTVFLGAFCVWSRANSSKTAPLPASVYKFKACPVHGTPLQIGTAVILYGKRNEIVFDFAARKRSFPQANTHMLGGCVVKQNSPSWQAVKFCPQCRAAEGCWLAVHHTTLPYS